ncbi:MAG TPA: hypothetical protein VJC18_04455, partial [bacterium]|nr:hypothetical protein [bacterium]
REHQGIRGEAIDDYCVEPKPYDVERLYYRFVDGAHQLVADEIAGHLLHYDALFIAMLVSLIEGRWIGLPTEAEFEYVARAVLGEQGWMPKADKARDIRLSEMAIQVNLNRSIRDLEPDILGFYGLLGVVSQHCADTMCQYSSDTQADPIGRGRNNERISRGAGKLRRPNHVHARFMNSPDDAYSSNAIRLVGQ